jgi:outer membrane receptor protein involved in Fe transport
MHVRLLSLVCLVLAMPRLICAQSPARDPGDLARLSSEELLNLEVTSVSRKEERADTVPAAIFVLTQDDIHRSGIRTLPDLFRLVPGVQVAQVNASNWAVSVRGFNDVYSNKVGVLGNPNYRAEQFNEFELGYRVKPHPPVDVACSRRRTLNFRRSGSA